MTTEKKKFETFGEVVKYVRWWARVSQKKLGEEIGCTQNTLCQYESNKRVPHYRILKSLESYIAKNDIPVSLF